MSTDSFIRKTSLHKVYILPVNFGGIDFINHVRIRGKTAIVLKSIAQKTGEMIVTDKLNEATKKQHIKGTINYYWHYLRYSMLFVALLCLLLICGALANVDNQYDIIIPQNTIRIDAEAFMNDTCIYTVYLPENLLTIRSKAFAYSSIKKLFTPESLAFIANDAFEGCDSLVVYGIAGSYTDTWCQHNNIAFIALGRPDPEVSPSPEPDNTSEPGPQPGAIVLTYAEINPIDNTTMIGKLAGAFKSKVEELSDRTIFIDIKDGGVYGTTHDVLENMREGETAVDICRCSSADLKKLGCSRMAVLEMPYLFGDHGHFRKFLASNLCAGLLQEMQEKSLGIRGLCLAEEGFRCFFFRNSVKNINDLRGKKIRVSSDNLARNLVACLDAIPASVPFSELYSALATGTIDAADAIVQNYKSNSFDEVAPFLMMDRHNISSVELVVSDKTWLKLSDEQKNWVKEAADYASIVCCQAAEEAEISTKAELINQNSTIIEINDKTPWRNAISDLVVSSIPNDIALYNAILALE